MFNIAKTIFIKADEILEITVRNLVGVLRIIPKKVWVGYEKGHIVKFDIPDGGGVQDLIFVDKGEILRVKYIEFGNEHEDEIKIDKNELLTGLNLNKGRTG